MQSGHFQSGDLSLYYETHGSGLPLICLSGGPGLPHGYLAPFAQLAGDGIQVIFFDQRGTGKSDKADPAEYTIPNNVADVEALRRHLGIEAWCVLGFSWGGMLAQAYAATHPARVSKLVLSDTFSSIADLNAALDRLRASVSPELQELIERYEEAGLYAQGDSYPDEYAAAVETAYEPVTLGIPAPPALQEALSQFATDVYRAMWGENSEFEITGTLTQLDSLLDGKLERVTAPTLVVVGASDMATVEMAARTALLFSPSHLEIFEHSRHFPYLEEPDKFFNLLRRFLGTTRLSDT